MIEEQGNLTRNFDVLIDIFELAEVDWQIAVTTTDVEDARYRGLVMRGDDEIILRRTVVLPTACSMSAPVL